jgi:ribosomal-protein-alanine N-acetyltransferase
MPNYPVHLDTPPIRLATQVDVGVLATIHAAAFPAAEAWSRDVFSLQLGLPNVIGLLHAEDGLILVRVAAGEAEILTLAVVPAARRRGMASRLLTAAVIRLAAAGANVVLLYLHHGFTQVGRRPAYYSDRSDALVLRMDLVMPS